MNNSKQKQNIFFLLLLVFFVISIPGIVFAQVDNGLKATAEAAKLDKFGNNVPKLAGNVIGTALSMIGVLFFILMIYGGFLWMTAKGDEGQTKKALDTITAATIGMIIVLASYAITNFVFKSVVSGEPGRGSACPSGSDSQCAGMVVGDTCRLGGRDNTCQINASHVCTCGGGAQ